MRTLAAPSGGVVDGMQKSAASLSRPSLGTYTYGVSDPPFSGRWQKNSLYSVFFVTFDPGESFISVYKPEGFWSVSLL